MLQPMTQKEVNRIIRSSMLACTKDLRELNKWAYNWLMIKSGFIAHYNLNGFIAYYTVPEMENGKPVHGSVDWKRSALNLGKDVLLNAKYNMITNRKKSDKEYPYYLQQGEMYQSLVKVIENNAYHLIPAETECFVAPNIWEHTTTSEGKDFYVEQDLYNEAYRQFSNNFSFGNYFGVTKHSVDRIQDLADAVVAYYHYVIISSQEDLIETIPSDKIMRKEFTFKSGNVATIQALLEQYKEDVHNIFGVLSGYYDTEGICNVCFMQEGECICDDDDEPDEVDRYFHCSKCGSDQHELCKCEDELKNSPHLVSSGKIIINPEADEISDEDLQAAATLFDRIVEESRLESNEVIVRCSTCHEDKPCIHYNLYAFGSEGVMLCRECRINICEAIQLLSRAHLKVKLDAKKNDKTS